MTIEMPELRPVRTHVPVEILIKIAEACISPYSITVEDTKQSYHNEHAINSPAKLAVVSRHFHTGITRGLQTNFNGHLTIPDQGEHKITDILQRRCPAWVTSTVTHLVISHSGPYKGNKLSELTLSYPTLKHLGLVFLLTPRGPGTQGLPEEDWIQRNARFLQREALRYQRDLQSLPSAAKFLISFKSILYYYVQEPELPREVIEEEEEGKGTEKRLIYHNIELPSSEKIATYCSTTTLDWNIYSMLNKDGNDNSKSLAPQGSTPYDVSQYSSDPLAGYRGEVMLLVGAIRKRPASAEGRSAELADLIKIYRVGSSGS